MSLAMWHTCGIAIVVVHKLGDVAYTCGIAMVVVHVAWQCGEDKDSINFFSASRNETDGIGSFHYTC